MDDKEKIKFLEEVLRIALIDLEFYGDERNYDGSARLSAPDGRPWVNHVGAERATKTADKVRKALAVKMGFMAAKQISFPCVVCRKETILACADCAIDSAGNISVHVCMTCRDEHEQIAHARR